MQASQGWEWDGRRRRRGKVGNELARSNSMVALLPDSWRLRFVDNIKGYSPSLEATNNPAWSMTAQLPLACHYSLLLGIPAGHSSSWSQSVVSTERVVGALGRWGAVPSCDSTPRDRAWANEITYFLEWLINMVYFSIWDEYSQMKGMWVRGVHSCIALPLPSNGWSSVGLA